MNAKLKHNWRGVLELTYKCPACRCTLTSYRKEVEEGKDTCPECREMITFPRSLPSKFDAAQKEHEANIAAEREKKLILKEDKKKEKAKKATERTQRKHEKAQRKLQRALEREEWKQALNKSLGELVGQWAGMLVVGVFVGSICIIVWGTFVRPAFFPELEKIAAARGAQIENQTTDWQSIGNTQRAEQQQAKVRKALNEKFVNAKGTGVFGTYEHKRVRGGYVTEIEGKNAFGGTVRNSILTTDDGKQINLTAP